MRSWLLQAVACCWMAGCSSTRSKGFGPVESQNLLFALDNASFDGSALSGRLSVGAKKDGQKVNPGAWPVFGLLVDSATRCDASGDLPLYVSCGGRVGTIATPTVVSMYAGDWYARDIRRLVFLEKHEDCVLLKAALPGAVVDDPESVIALHIRAERKGEVRLLRVVRTPAATSAPSGK